MACAELEIIVEIPTLRQGALKCLADLTVIIHRPPAGILDGVVKMILQTVRTCPLSHIISIGKFSWSDPSPARRLNTEHLEK